MSPRRRKKPARPRSQAAKQRSRRARKKATSKAGPKGSAKRTARRGSRASRKAATRPARTAKPARRAGDGPVSPAGRPRRATAARRATLHMVTRKTAKSRPKPEPRPFAGAMESASAKDLAIFDLVRARVEVQAAIQGLQPGSADQPVEAGKWSPREIVLHLHYWDREMLPFLERAWRHDERPPHTKEQILAENDAFLGELGPHDWDEARRLMQHSRESFLEALQSVPEEPAEMWSSEHALGWLVRILSHHDRHHAAVIKHARSRAPASATESP